MESQLILIILSEKGYCGGGGNEGKCYAKVRLRRGRRREGVVLFPSSNPIYPEPHNKYPHRKGTEQVVGD